MLYGIIGSILGALAVWIISLMVHRFQEVRGLFTGEWDQIIFDENERTKVVKRDVVKCHQRGEMVEGVIQRREPYDQAYRKWHFRGLYRGQLFFGHFWSAIPENPSYGTLQLRQIGENHFTGFYVRLGGIDEKEGRVTKFTEELKTIPFEWRKRTKSRFQKPH